MTKSPQKPYYLGLNIDDNKVAWCVMDHDFHLLRVRQHPCLGERKFEIAQGAADRRTSRASRRNTARTHLRIQRLNQIFAPALAQLDPTFLQRVQNNIYAARDPQHVARASFVFNDPEKEAAYHHDYPTIYHLRQALVAHPEKQFDLRLIYLAILNIMKHRGHFYDETPVSSFDTKQIDLRALLTTCERANSAAQLNLAQVADLSRILLDKQLTKAQCYKQLVACLTLTDAHSKAQTRLNKQFATQVANAIVGRKTKFDVLVNHPDAEDGWNFSFADASADEEVDALAGSATDNEMQAIQAVRDIYNWQLLNHLVPHGDTFSAAQVEKYDKFHRQKDQLAQVIQATWIDMATADQLRAILRAYRTKRNARDKKYQTEDFYRDLTKVLTPLAKDHPDKKVLQEITNAINQKDFMVRLKSTDNRVIPHQLHQQELRKIMANQGAYYPWLQEQAAKLEQLFAFTIPYYVGPLVDADSEAGNANKFAWMKRKAPGEITPWNYQDKIDMQQTAQRFIRRMTAKDTLFLGEDVLPRHSLLYEAMTVLDELHNIRVNDQPLSPKEIRAVFHQVFQKKRKVSVRDVVKFWESHPQEAPAIQDGTYHITQLANPTHFDNDLSSYVYLHDILGDAVDDLRYRQDVEKIIEWATIFQDKHMMATNLATLKWLTSTQRERLANWHLQGWGRYSARLLQNIMDAHDHNVMQIMWTTMKNSSQALAVPAIKQQIDQHNQRILKHQSLDDILNNAYASPIVKRVIHQAVRVVQNLIKEIGYAPQAITLNSTRQPNPNAENYQLLKRVRQMYKRQSDLQHSDLGKQLKKEKMKAFNRKRFLYYRQAGCDFVTGKPLNLDRLEQAHVAHIMPASWIKDDSLNNLCLTTVSVHPWGDDESWQTRYGEQKMPVDLWGNTRVASYWRSLLDHELITKKMYWHTQDSLQDILKNRYETNALLHSQLTTKGHSLKLLASILQSRYVGTPILQIPSARVRELRYAWKLPEVEAVNDYQKPFDAYLGNIIGYYLYESHPKLRHYFIYGDWLFKQTKTGDAVPQDEQAEMPKISSFNLINPLVFAGQPPKATQKNPPEYQLKFDGKALIQYVQKVYQYKNLPVTEALTNNDHRMLFNETTLPRPDKARAELVPIKQGMDPLIYGGRSFLKTGHLAIIKFPSNPPQGRYQVVGISAIFAQELQKYQYGSDAYRKALIEVINHILLRHQKRIKPFQLILANLPLGQLVTDQGTAFRLATGQYYHPVQQLVLSTESMQKLVKPAKERTSEDMMAVYQEIVTKVTAHFPLFAVRDGFAKLKAGAKVMAKKDPKEQYQLIMNLLQGLHANGGSVSLRELGFKSPFGLFSAIPLRLSAQAALIFESITGLDNHRVPLGRYHVLATSTDNM